MNNIVISKVIGQLVQDENFSDWWNSEKIEIPFFDKEKLTIRFMNFEPERDLTFLEEVDQALTNFLELKIEDKKSISELAYKNCMEFLDEFEFDEADNCFRQIENKDDIWHFIHPTEILLSRRPYNEQDIYVLIACECDWEKEHGLQLVFRQGRKLTRISEQDGHLTEADAYNKPDEEDELLSKFE